MLNVIFMFLIAVAGPARLEEVDGFWWAREPKELPVDHPASGAFNPNKPGVNGPRRPGR